MLGTQTETGSLETSMVAYMLRKTEVRIWAPNLNGILRGRKTRDTRLKLKLQGKTKYTDRCARGLLST